MSKNIVIVGANRGIGFELTQQYQALGYNVVALCRKASPQLNALTCTVIENIEVSDDRLLENIESLIPVDSIDILIHNAGILASDTIDSISFDNMREHFDINSLGPLRTVLGLKNKLKHGSKVGIISSRVGSIEDNSGSNNYAYRVSKTATNMIGKCLSIDLKAQGIAVALLHPGYVRTEMTNNNGLINAHESAEGLIQRMQELTLDTTGMFVHTSSEILTW